MLKEISKPIFESILTKLNNLYVMTRFKYLLMYVGKSGTSRWITVPRTLTNRQLTQHLNQKKTIGVFSGESLTKFICFDVDSPTIENSRVVTSMLHNVLVEEFNMPDKDIHISFSGKKGYHVEIFFSESLSLELVRNFYDVVMAVVHNISTFIGEIEFRPNFNQGVKLPLSVHQETGNVCWFVDKNSFEPIKDYEYVLDIVPMDVEYFKESVLDTLMCDAYFQNYFTMEHTSAVQTETLIKDVKPYQKTTDMYHENMLEVLQENRLIRNGTRHSTTFYLSIYLRDRGYTRSHCMVILTNILMNTWENYRELISADTTKEFMLSEVDRLTNLAYKKDFKRANKEVRLYKSELLQILSLSTKKLRLLLFSLYIHSKKYAKDSGEFFMAYSVLEKMGNPKNPSENLPSLIKLEDVGLISIVKRNKTNAAMTALANKHSEGKKKRISETNVYKVTLAPVPEGSPYLNVSLDKEITIYEAVRELVTEKEAKEKLPKNQFYTEYKPIYKEAHK